MNIILGIFKRYLLLLFIFFLFYIPFILNPSLEFFLFKKIVSLIQNNCFEYLQTNKSNCGESNNSLVLEITYFYLVLHSLIIPIYLLIIPLQYFKIGRLVTKIFINIFEHDTMYDDLVIKYSRDAFAILVSLYFSLFVLEEIKLTFEILYLNRMLLIFYLFNFIYFLIIFVSLNYLMKTPSTIKTKIFSKKK